MPWSWVSSFFLYSQLYSAMFDIILVAVFTGTHRSSSNREEMHKSCCIKFIAKFAFIRIFLVLFSVFLLLFANSWWMSQILYRKILKICKVNNLFCISLENVFSKINFIILFIRGHKVLGWIFCILYVS